MEPEEIKKAFSEGIKEFGEKMKTVIAESIAPVQKSVEELDKRIIAIEKMPVHKATFGINVIPGKYHGRNLEDMGGSIYHKASKDPTRFPIFSNAEKLHDFKKYMIDVVRSLAFKDPTSIQALQQRAAMAEGADGTGGYLVPAEYEWEMIQLVRESAFAINKCTVIPMSSTTLQLPAESTLCTVAWISENSTITASDPTVTRVLLTAKKLAALTTAMSNELLADSAIDIVSWLTEQFGYAILQELDNQVLNGSGSPVSGILGTSLITGVAGYSAVMVAGSTSTSNIYADIFRNAMRKVSIKDAMNAEWVFGKDTRFYLETLKTAYGNYVYRQPGDASFGPGTLWGRPVNEVNKAPAETSSANTPIAAFGDWKQYYIGQRRGVGRIDADPYSSFATDGTRFRLVSRWGLAPARTTAFCRVLTGASS